MSVASRSPGGRSSSFAIPAVVTILTRIRDFVARYFGGRVAKNLWRVIAIAVALANMKNLPGFWHIRVLRGIVYQLYFQPTQQKPRDLFKPLITASRNTPYDCDYNLHKSNSTYFADLDVARAHLMSAIIQTGLARLKRGDEEGLPAEARATKGTYSIALGAVGCFFQREIQPMEPFEIHTRVLSWDRKWLYLVSHIVKKGAIKPERYALQPWKRGKQRSGKEKTDDRELSKHIFATSIARYVFKKGRLTVNPETVLERSHLLPSRPAGIGLPPRAEASESSSATQSELSTPAPDSDLASQETVAAEVSEMLNQAIEDERDDADGGWTWDDMEKERLRGLQIAKHFDALNGLQHEIRGGEALGQYSDYW